MVFDTYPEGKYTTFRYSLQSYSTIRLENTKIKLYIKNDSGMLNPSALFTVFAETGIPIEAISNEGQYYYLLNNETNYYITAKSSAVGNTYYAYAEAVNGYVPEGYAKTPASSQFTIIGQRGVDSLTVDNESGGRIYLLRGKQNQIIVRSGNNARIDDLVCVPSSNEISIVEQKNEGTKSIITLFASESGEYQLSFIAGNGYTHKVDVVVGDAFESYDIEIDENSNITSSTINEDDKTINITAKTGYDLNFYVRVNPCISVIQKIDADSEDANFNFNNSFNNNKSNNPFSQFANIGTIEVIEGDLNFGLTFTIAKFEDNGDYVTYGVSTDVWTVNIKGITTSSISLEQSIINVYSKDSIGYKSNISSSGAIKLNFASPDESSLFQYLDEKKIQNETDDGKGFIFGDATASISYRLISGSFVFGTCSIDQNQKLGTISLGFDDVSDDGCYVEITINEFGQESKLIAKINVLQAVTTKSIEVTNADIYDASGNPVIYLKRNEVKDLSIAVSPNNITSPGYTYFTKQNDTYTTNIDSDVKIVNDQIAVGGTITEYTLYIVANDSIKNYTLNGETCTFANLTDDHIYVQLIIEIEDGTPKSPYQVKNVDDLLGIMYKNVYGGNEVKTYYQLCADIDVSTITGPIDEGKGFSNSLNGYNTKSKKFYKLYGFQYNDNAFEGNFGLFSTISSNAEIINMHIDVANINITTLESESRIDNIGIYAGINNGIISNSSVSINKFTINANAKANIGGLVGSNRGEIYNYYSNEKASEEADYSSIPTTEDGLNNVLDKTYSTNIANGNMTINSNKQVNVGGLVGFVDERATVMGIFAVYEAISNLSVGDSQTADYTVTFESQGIDSSVNINISGGHISNQGSSVGGVIGSIGSSGDPLTRFDVFGLSSESVIGYRVDTQYSINGNVGGVIGSAYGTSYSNADNRIIKIFASSYIKTKGNVGGLIGYINKASINSSRVELYETKTNKDTAIISNGNVGGVVGFAENAQFVDTFIKSFYISEMTKYSQINKYYGDILLLSNGEQNNVGGFAGYANNTIFDAVYSVLNMQYYKDTNFDPSGSEIVHLSPLIGYADSISIYNFYTISEVESNLSKDNEDVAVNKNIKDKKLYVNSICNYSDYNKYATGYVATKFNGEYLEAISETSSGNVEGVVTETISMTDNSFNYNGTQYTYKRTFNSREILVYGTNTVVSVKNTNNSTITLSDGRRLELEFSTVEDQILVGEDEYQTVKNYYVDYKMYSSDNVLMEEKTQILYYNGENYYFTIDQYLDFEIIYGEGSALFNNDNVDIETGSYTFGFKIEKDGNEIKNIEYTSNVKEQDVTFELTRVARDEYQLTSNINDEPIPIFSSTGTFGVALDTNNLYHIQLGVLENGEDRYEQLTNEDGKPAVDEDGNPIMGYVYYYTGTNVWATLDANLSPSSIVYNENYLVVESNEAYLDDGTNIKLEFGVGGSNDIAKVSQTDNVDIQYNEASNTYTFTFDDYKFELKNNSLVAIVDGGNVNFTKDPRDNTKYTGTINGKTYELDLTFFVKDNITAINFVNITDGAFVCDGITFTYASGTISASGYDVYRSTVKNNIYVAIEAGGQNSFYFEVNGSQVKYVKVVSRDAWFTPKNKADLDSYIISNNGLPVLYDSNTKPLISLTPQNIDIYPSVNNTDIPRTIISSSAEGVYDVQLIDGTNNNILSGQTSSLEQPELVLYYKPYGDDDKNPNSDDDTNPNSDDDKNPNVYELADIFGVVISPSEIKNVRVICDYDSNIISIDNSGNLTLNGTGYATIDFSAIKNYAAQDKVDILIKPYVDNFTIYSNENLTSASDEDTPINIERNSAHTLYPKFSYDGVIINQEVVVDYEISYKPAETNEYTAITDEEINKKIYIQNNALYIMNLSDEEAITYKDIKVVGTGYYYNNGIKIFANKILTAAAYFNIVTEARGIFSNTNAVEFTPMDSISFVVNIDSDNKTEDVSLTLTNKLDPTSAYELNTEEYNDTKKYNVMLNGQQTGLVIEVTGSGTSKLITLSVLEGESDAETLKYRYLTENLNYTLQFTPTSNKNIYCSVDVTIKPQELLGLDMSSKELIYEGASTVGSTDKVFIFSENEEYTYNPGSVVLIEIDSFPNYAYVDDLYITTSSLDGGKSLRFDQIYAQGENTFVLNNGFAPVYAQENGSLRLNLLSSIQEDDEKVTTQYNGKIYVRATIPSDIYEESVFAIEVKSTRAGAVITNEMFINVRKVPKMEIIAERDKIVKMVNYTDNKDKLEFELKYSEDFDVKNITLSLINEEGNSVGNIPPINDLGKSYVELDENQVNYGETIYIKAHYVAIVNGTLIESEIRYPISVVDYYIENVSVKGVNEDNILNLAVNNTQRLNVDIEGIGSDTVKEGLEENISRAINSNNTAKYWYYVDASGTAKSIDDASLTGLPYQVQKVNLNSNNSIISLKGLTQGAHCNLRLTFDVGYVVGQISINADNSQTYKYDFILNVYLNAVEDNPEPIYTVEQLYDMQPEGDYILMNDLVLNNHTPINTNIGSLDGNNKVITINSFNILEINNNVNIGFFGEVSKNTILKNIIVALPANNEIATPLNNYSQINYGGLAAINNGIITNSETVALYPSNAEHASYVFNATTSEQASSVYVGGLVAQNNGIITNSRVGRAEVVKVNYDSQLSVSTTYFDGVYNRYLIKVKGKAIMGGFVAQNTGIISSCYVDNIQLENDSVSSDLQKTAGFVAENNEGALITGSYVKGWFSSKTDSDSDDIKGSVENYYQNGQKVDVPKTNPYIQEDTHNIYRMMGGGIYASGNAGGFVYENAGEIENSYSSVNLKGNSTKDDVNLSVGGFVYNNKRGGNITTSYSMSNVRSGTSYGPFTGFGLDGTLLAEEGSSITKSYYLQEKDQDLYKQEEPAYAINQQISFNIGDTEIGDESTEANKFIDKKSFGGFSFDSLNYDEIKDNYSLKSGSIWAMRLLGQENGYPELISANDIAISVRVWDSVAEDGKNIYQYVDGYSIGSEVNPIVISDAKQFVNIFKNYYDALKGIFQNVEFEAKYQGNIRLIDNISFADDIDSEIKDFDISKFTITSNKNSISVIDGNSLTISGINLSTQNELPSYGLFKGLYGVGVKNLTLDISKISADNTVAVGGLAGVIVDSDINNVNIISTVKIDEEQVIKGSRFVGGLAGIIIASPITEVEEGENANVHNINAIYSNVSVVASYTKSQDATLTTYDKLSSKNIWNAIAPPSVTGTSNNNDLQYKNLFNFSMGYAGGIAGVIDISQDFSMYEENVARAVETPNVISVKVDYGTNDNLFNVTGVNAGGLFGFVGNETYIYGADFVTLSSNIGGKHFINAKLFAGGIAAVNYGRIERAMVSYDESEQEQFDDNIASFVSGNVSTVEMGSGNLFTGSPYYIGGLVGFNSIDNYDLSGYISDTYNRVNIYNTNVNNNGAIGGLIGLSYYGEVRVSYTTAALMGGQKTAIGGLIGEVASTNYNGSAYDQQSVVNLFFLNGLNIFAPTTEVQNYYKNRATHDDGSLINVSGFVGKNSSELSKKYDLEEIRVQDKLYLTYTSSGTIYEFESNKDLPNTLFRSFNKDKFSLLMNFTSEGQVSVATRQEFFDESYWKPSVWNQSLDLVLPRLIFGYNPSVILIYNADQFIENIVNSSSSSAMYVIMNDIDMSLVSHDVSASKINVTNNFRGKIFGSKTYVGGRNPILFNLDISSPLFAQLYNATISGVNFHISSLKDDTNADNSYGAIVAQMSRSTINKVTITDTLSNLVPDGEKLYVNKKNSDGSGFEENYNVIEDEDGNLTADWIVEFTNINEEGATYTYKDSKNVDYSTYFANFKSFKGDKTIEDLTTDIKSSSRNVGVVVGLATSSYINNTTVDLTNGLKVTIDDSDLQQYNVGGIVGYITGQISNVTLSIQNITINGNKGDEPKEVNVYVGGIAGYQAISVAKLSANTNITIDSQVHLDELYIGGIFGGKNIDSTLEIATTSDDLIQYTGNITVDDGDIDNLYIGGIAGEKEDANNNPYWVVSDITVNGTIKNNLYVAGLFGTMSNGTLINSSYTGNININKLSPSENYVSGAVGYATHPLIVSNNLISANINVADSATEVKELYVGGLIGTTTSTIVFGNVDNGKTLVFADINNNSIAQNVYIAGVVGLYPNNNITIGEDIYYVGDIVNNNNNNNSNLKIAGIFNLSTNKMTIINELNDGQLYSAVSIYYKGLAQNKNAQLSQLVTANSISTDYFDTNAHYVESLLFVPLYNINYRTDTGNSITSGNVLTQSQFAKELEDAIGSVSNTNIAGGVNFRDLIINDSIAAKYLNESAGVSKLNPIEISSATCTIENTDKTYTIEANKHYTLVDNYQDGCVYKLTANVDGATITAYGNKVTITSTLGKNATAQKPTVLSGAMVTPFDTNNGILYESGATDKTDIDYGLVNINNGYIIKCYSRNNIIDKTVDVAGLVCTNNGTISNSYYAGRIETTGIASGLVYTNNDGYIDNCYTIGNIKGSEMYPIVAVKEGNATNKDNISNCFYDIFSAQYNSKEIGYGATTSTLMGVAFENDLNWHSGDKEIAIKYLKDIAEVSKLNYNYGYPILALGRDWSNAFEKDGKNQAGKEIEYYNSLYTGGEGDEINYPLITSGEAFEIISAGQFEFYADMNYKSDASKKYKIMNTIDFIMFNGNKGNASSNYSDLGENGKYESTYLWSSQESKLAYSKITGNNFSGTINGNSQEFINIQSVDGILPLASGVTISYLTIIDASLDQTAGTTSMTDSGILFGTLSGDSKIDNLTFKNITVNSKGNNVGLIIGQNNTTLTITNMKIDSDADADVSKVNTLTSTYTEGAYVGGIIGQSSGTITISGSDAYNMTVNLPSNATFGNLVGVANGNITSDFNNTFDYTYVFTSDKTITMGGLVGELTGGAITSTSTSTLKTNDLGSYNDGTNTYIAKYVGGIVGKLTGGTINYIPIVAGIELTGCTTGAIAGYMSGGTIDYGSKELNKITPNELKAITLNGNTIGGVVGEMTGGTISNIIVNNVTFKNLGEGYDFVTFGGAVGKISEASECTIENVTVINANNNNRGIYSSLDGENYYFGGLVGVINTTSTVNISSSTNEWAIYNPTAETTINFAIGGFIGQIQNGTITISGSTNTVNIGNDKVQYASGFIAYVDNGNINLEGQSTNSGVIGTQNSDIIPAPESAGGFIGYINSSATINIYGTIKNTAAITGINAGGFIGKMISGSITTSEGSSITNSGVISGVDYAGGLFGYINATINIQKATNSGIVNVTSESGSLGGIFGYLESTSISITNNISNSASAHIGGNGNGKNVGGIIGQLEFSGSKKSTITATNSGEIGTSSTSPLSKQLNLGGIVGSATSSTKNFEGTTAENESGVGDETQIDTTDNIVLVIENSSNTGTVHGKPSEITSADLLYNITGVENKANVLKYIVTDNGGVFNGGAFSGGIVGYGINIGISGSNNNGYIGQAETINADGTSVRDAGQNNSGGIAGKICNSTIYNSHNANESEIVIGGGAGKEFVSAGIVAYATGGSLIDNCTNSAKYIDGTMDGGIVAVLENSTVNNCRNYGQAGIDGDSFAGGIAALVIHSTIDESTNSGAIHDARVSGGIAAVVLDDLSDNSRNGSQIKNSTNSASVNVIDGYGYLGYTMAGGIVAFMRAKTYDDTANISGSKTVGEDFDVGTSTTYVAGGVSGSNTSGEDFDVGTSTTYVAGGVVGYLLSGSIQGGDEKTKVVVSGATVTGYYAGGVVGYVSPTNDMTISYIDNQNTVNGANNSYKDDSYGAIGGIIGYIGSGLVKKEEGETTEKTKEDISALVSIIGCDNKAAIGEEVNTRPNAGGIVGQVGEKEIANSTHYASVYIENCKNEHAIYGRFTGGILGRGYVNTSRKDKTIIKNGTNSNQVYGYKGDAGGIVGILQVKQAGNQTTQAEIIAVDNGTNNGQILTDTDASTNRSLGGIAGYIENASIKGSNNESNQSWNSLTGKNINLGGIVGHINNGNIEDSKNNTNIIADIDIGGIVGKTSGGNVNITNCTQNGAVTGGNKAGGIACVVGSTETEINNCTMNGNITAKAGAGGIVCDATTGEITISGCTYNGDNVTVEGSALGTDSYNYAGGIIGYTNQDLTINNTTANNTTANVSKVQVTAGAENNKGVFAGGIVGCASGGGSIENVAVKNGIIISAPTANEIKSFAGGVAGYLRRFGYAEMEGRGIGGLTIKINTDGYNTNFNVTARMAGGIAGQADECIVPMSFLLSTEILYNPVSYRKSKHTGTFKVSTITGTMSAGALVGEIINGSYVYIGGREARYSYYANISLSYAGNITAQNVGLIGKSTSNNYIQFFGAGLSNYSDDALINTSSLSLNGTYTGNLVGYNGGTLTIGGGKQSRWGVNVIAGSNLKAKYAGGMVGYNAFDLIVNNSTIKNFDTENSNATYVGGILAYQHGGTEANISYCSVIDATLDARGDVESGEVRTVGGIVGKNVAVVSDRVRDSILNIQNCNVTNSDIQSTFAQTASSVYAAGNKNYKDKEYNDGVFKGTNGVSSISNENQKVDSIEIKAGVYLGGLIGYYTNKGNSNISNNTISSTTISHNIITNSNDKSIDTIYPVGGKFIGYATLAPKTLNNNKFTSSTINEHKDKFRLYSAIFNERLIWWNVGFYYLDQVRSYCGSYSIGREDKETSYYVWNDNVYADEVNGGINLVLNNYIINDYGNKDSTHYIENSLYGYCKVDSLSKATRGDKYYDVNRRTYTTSGKEGYKYNVLTENQET